VNRFLAGLKKAATISAKTVERVAESPIAADVVETIVPVAAPEISLVHTLLEGENKPMDFESLGIMLAVQALNTYIKNPKKNTAVTAQLATACTDVLQDLGYTVTAPTKTA
jgi:hypothetical protein